MLEGSVRFVHHAALLLLVLLLAGGPAVRAAAMVKCAPGQTHCAMCEHRVERMPCMGRHEAHVRVAAPAIAADAVFAVNSDCLCEQAPARQVEQAQAAPAPCVDQAPAVAVGVEPAWPPLQVVVGRGVSLGAPVGIPALHSRVAAPLRV